MSIYLQLFLVFAKIGVLTIGGGYAMLPMMMRELVEARGWLTNEEFADMTAIGQCTPGVIAVNMSTFVGFRQRRTAGALIASLGIVLPSVIIITIIAAVLKQYTELEVVRHAFAGIRVAVCGLITKTVVSLWKSSISTPDTVIIVVAVFVIAIFGVTSPGLLAIGSALVCVFLGLRTQKREGGDEK